jgi:4-amino-4-deoxy-L-arabinose transferase-like glycosyltransferase
MEAAAGDKRSGRWSLEPRTIVLGLTITAAYLVTRLVFMARFPYFFDEGTYAAFIEQAGNSTSRLFVSLSIGREPLQIWLGVFWLKLGFDPLVAGRLVSVTAGLLTVGVIGLLGRRAGGAQVGWTAAALAVLLPFFVVHDGIGIYEPLVTLIVAAALLLQLEIARRPTLLRGLLLGLVLASGVLTKRNTAPALFLIPFSLLCFDWSQEDRRRKIGVWAGAIAVAGACAVIAWLVLRSSAYWDQYQAFNEADERGVTFSGVRPLGQVLEAPFAFSGQAWAAFRSALIGYLTVPLVLAAFAGAVTSWRKQRPLAAVLLVWIAVPFVVGLTFSTLAFPRHAMYLMPPVLVFVATALVGAQAFIRRSLPSRAAAIAVALGAIAVLGPAVVFDARLLLHPRTTHYPGGDDAQYVTGTQAGGSWDAVADLIHRRATGRRVTVLTANSYPDVIRQMVKPRARYEFANLGSSKDSQAQFVIVDDLRFVEGAAEAAAKTIKEQGFTLIGRFPRPRGGAVVELHERPPAG